MIELLSLVVYFVTHKIMIITLYKKRKCFTSTFQIMTTDMRFKKNKLLNSKLSLKNITLHYSGAVNLEDFLKCRHPGPTPELLSQHLLFNKIPVIF